MSFSLPIPVRAAVYALSEGVKAHLRSTAKGRELTPVRLSPALAHAETLAVLVVQNEAPRFDYLLDYYRRFGVDQFVVIDNRSTDDLVAQLEGHDDVSVYRADGEYGAARYGNDWVNAVLARHGVGRWILYVDADEFLVVHSSAKTLGEITSRLEHAGHESLQTMMLDMYSDGPPEDNVVLQGNDPLEICGLYDREGYVRRYDVPSNTTWIKGGVRGRAFFSDDVWSGPALNKTPLVRWRRHYAFIKSAHELWPPRLNAGETPVRGILLHFKFTAAAVDKIVDHSSSGQHTSEYAAYSDVKTKSLVGVPTTRYRGPEGLAEDGLLSPL